ncbi:DnaJ domain-containing protein [Oceanicoccus sp. KOV_DT_Chl]|uniref:DnaJ domain-containing protein n=1 Tax=Oceanicoccus sp. KOV_DT_Chl TaxID=1904639 RepID=UPI000C7D923F|nr:DnaJ domain-containing protein [Oceanicoccus sp. KOV_DT_Chl]
MIVRLILLIAFVVVVLTLINKVKKTPKAQMKKVYWSYGLGAAAILLILLAATGRIHWIGAMIGAAIPLAKQALPYLIRYFPYIQQHLRKPAAASSSNNGSNQSQVKTAVLTMTLNHDTQQLSGEVNQGPLAGQQLDALELSQLQALLDYCHQQDKDSVKLLMSYLDHRFGNQWQSRPPPNNSGEMNEDSAYAVLGLPKGASKQDVIQAHRKMMQKVHPDRGGSDYLAAQINQAKDLLLSRLS